MKNLFLLIVSFVILSCIQQEDVSSQTEVNLTTTSQNLIKNQKKFSVQNLKGKTIKLNDGVIHFFNESKKDVFSNVLALIPENKEDIQTLNNFFSENTIQLNFNDYHLTLKNNSNKTLYFIVKNELGHKMMHDLESKSNIMIIKGLQLSNWYGEERFNINIESFDKEWDSYSFDTFISNYDSRFSSGSCSSGGQGATPAL